MSYPVHPILPGLALHVIENGRHVVTDQVVDRPGRLTPLPQRGMAEESVDPVILAGPAVFSRAPDVEDVDLVAALTELGREIVVDDRPERGVEPQAMTENDRQLARIRMRGAVMTNAQPPAVSCVRITISARTKIGGRGVLPHAGTPRQAGAKHESRPELTPASVHCGCGVLPTINKASGILTFRQGRFYASGPILGMRARFPSDSFR